MGPVFHNCLSHVSLTECLKKYCCRIHASPGNSQMKKKKYLILRLRLWWKAYLYGWPCIHLSFEASAAAEVVAAVPVLALSVAPPPTGAQDPSLKPDSVSASMLEHNLDKTDRIRIIGFSTSIMSWGSGYAWSRIENLQEGVCLNWINLPKLEWPAVKNGKIVKNVNKVVNFAGKVGNMQMKLCWS